MPKMMFITNLISKVERGGSEEGPGGSPRRIEEANAAANKFIQRRSSLLEILSGLFNPFLYLIKFFRAHFYRYAHHQCPA